MVLPGALRREDDDVFAPFVLQSSGTAGGVIISVVRTVDIVSGGRVFTEIIGVFFEPKNATLS